MKERSKKDFSYDDILLLGVLLCNIGYFFVTPFRNMAVRHVFVFSGSILFYLIAIERIRTVVFSMKKVLSILLLIIAVFFEIICINTEYSFELFYSLLNFFTLFIIITTNSNQSCSKRQIKWIYYSSIIISLLLIVISFTSSAYVFEDGRNTGALVLGMTNPNFTAMMIFGVFSIIVINIKNSNKKILLTILLVVLLYLMWLTRARSAIITSLLELLYVLFFSKHRISNIIVIIALIFPVVFSAIYLKLYHIGFGIDFDIGDKPLFSGRELIYEMVYEKFSDKSYLLWGDLGNTHFANAHNAPLTIVATIGLFCFIIFYYRFSKHLIELNKNAKSVISRAAVVCLLGVCIQSSTESLMFTGVFPGITFVFVYYQLIELTNRENRISNYSNSSDDEISIRERFEC